MRVFVGLGSNLGDRAAHLEAAARALSEISPGKYLRASSVYETPALVPAGAPAAWNLPYLNAVAEIRWENSASDLLAALKQIESTLGRLASPRWAPRPIDLDLLLFGNAEINILNLQVPHPEMRRRAFVLAPLADLAPSLRVPGTAYTVLQHLRQTPGRRPGLMAILNVTPDSFSDGGEANAAPALEQKLRAMLSAPIQAIDIGAESTRPGASPVPPAEEWRRLEPALRLWREITRGKYFFPRLSVDTRHPETAALARRQGAQLINDVSGHANPSVAASARSEDGSYVLMHSLGVPANPAIYLPEHEDPVETLRTWFFQKLARLKDEGFDLDHLWFDPGLGFGKTARQSCEIASRLHEFRDLPARLLVGHSRKSFLNTRFPRARDRDHATQLLSEEIAAAGSAELLRVHDFAAHAFLPGAKP